MQAEQEHKSDFKGFGKTLESTEAFVGVVEPQLRAAVRVPQIFGTAIAKDTQNGFFWPSETFPEFSKLIGTGHQTNARQYSHLPWH